MARRDRLSGNEAVAEALRQISPDVMAAFPITPSTEIPQYFSKLVADFPCFFLRDELGRLDAINHQPQFIRLKLRLCDVVAPFFGVVFYGNAEVYLKAENIVVDGFLFGSNALGGEILNNVVCVLRMLLIGIGIEIIPDVKQFHPLF